jgi:hypothetical protein
VNLAGGEDRTIVAYADSRLVCMGRCTQRECWLNGESKTVGYLGELRLEGSERGRFGILRDGYRFFHAIERDRPADLYFTSIADDNHRARGLLEAGVRGLPRYEFLAGLDTVLIAVRRRARRAKLRVETPTAEHLPELLQVLNDHACRHELAAVWTAERLAALQAHGLPAQRFRAVMDGGRIVACGALWDQRDFRQTVIRGYAPLLAAARPFLNSIGRLWGMPKLPKPHSVLPHAFLSPFAFARGAEALLPDLIEAFFPLAAEAGVEYLTVALPSTDGRMVSLCRRFSTRTWRSRLYRVTWPDLPGSSITRHAPVFLPDVALL